MPATSTQAAVPMLYWHFPGRGPSPLCSRCAPHEVNGEVDRAQTRSIWVTSGRQLWVLRFLTQPIPDSILSPYTAHGVPNTPSGDTGYAQLAQVATSPTQELSYQIMYETPSVFFLTVNILIHDVLSTYSLPWSMTLVTFCAPSSRISGRDT